MKQKQTAPWVSMDANWWPTIAAEMPRPWTRAAVLMDLRWWSDQEGVGRARRPGRPSLGRRWGWGDWTVRQVLKAEDEWGDKKAGRLQPASSSHPAPIQKASANPLESQAPPSSPPPALIQPASPRADIHTDTQTPIHTREQCSNEHTSDKVSQVWEKVNQIRKSHTPEARALKLNKARRAVLKARLEEHTEEEILRVIEWRENSPHSRAVFLREGGHGVDTLLRASKFEAYLDASFGDQAPTIHRKGGLMDPITAIRKAAESRRQKEAGAGTVVQFPHPLPRDP